MIPINTSGKEISFRVANILDFIFSNFGARLYESWVDQKRRYGWMAVKGWIPSLYLYGSPHP